MKPEFEEKSYESAFNAEFMRRTNLFFAPGQCAEGGLGFDFVAYLDDPFFWRDFPYLRRRRAQRLAIGTPLDEVANELARYAETTELGLPKFSGNVFIQYKRSDYLSRPNARDWKHWSAPYYRFKINRKQQDLLLAVSSLASGRAAVVYAAPVFWKMDMLFRHQQTGGIISNSNVSSVGLIGAGHKHFTYTQAGNLGMAFSEPEEINSPKLEEILEQQKENAGKTFRQHVKGLATELDAIMQRSWASKIWGNAKLGVLSRFVGEIERGKDLDEIKGSFLNEIVTLAAFRQVTGAGLFLVASGDGR